MVTPQSNNHSTIHIEECPIERAVLAITSVTSEKFVTEPDKTTVLSDLLIGLKRFRNAVRWKAFFMEKAEEQKNKENKEHSNEHSPIEEASNENASNVDTISNGSLNTNLKAENKSVNAPIASKQVEAFLNETEKSLIEQVNSFYDKKEPEDKKTNVTTKHSEIRDLMNLMKRLSKVAVPTDKTNSIILIETAKYIEWVRSHLDKAAIKSSTERIKEIFDNANELLLGMEELFDKMNTNSLKKQ